LVGRHRAGVVPGYGCLGLGEAEGQGLTLILFPFGGSRSRVGPAAAFVRLAFASRTTTDYAQFLTTCVRGLESRRGLGRRRAVRGVYQLVPSPTRAARTVQGILDGHAGSRYSRSSVCVTRLYPSRAAHDRTCGCGLHPGAAPGSRLSQACVFLSLPAGPHAPV
jgi:hypothetical protein